MQVFLVFWSFHWVLKEGKELKEIASVRNSCTPAQCLEISISVEILYRKTTYIWIR